MAAKPPPASAQPPPVKAPPAKKAPAEARQRRGARVPWYPPRAILNTIMTLAVIVLERRIRKALRSSG